MTAKICKGMCFTSRGVSRKFTIFNLLQFVFCLVLLQHKQLSISAFESFRRHFALFIKNPLSRQSRDRGEQHHSYWCAPSFLRHSPVSKTTASSSNIVALQEWLLTTSPSASMHESLKHARFGTLRGLEWTGPLSVISSASTSSPLSVITLPAAKVLQAPYPSKDWDSDLACQIWNECRLGKKSKFWGYIDMLTGGWTMQSSSLTVSASPLQQTAPNAIRHWTKAQQASLMSSNAGQRLIELADEQLSNWEKKYQALSANDRISMSFQQFAWAMEAVHSRAFCGPSESFSSPRIILSILFPLLGAMVGLFYQLNEPEPSPIVLTAFAVAISFPLLSSPLPNQNGAASSSIAVMLPLIDSINHLQEAGDDTIVQYDPLRNTFQLFVTGPKCVDVQTRQFFVSYGNKTDTELLLNYGFLPDVPCDDGEDDQAKDRQRHQLAKSFLSKNI